MSKTVRSISALGAVFFALVGLSACGSSSESVPSNSVASVNGTPITKDAFKHWMGVAAVSGASGALAGHTTPPEPPEYRACIAALKAVNKPPVSTKTLTVAQLKKDCEQQYQTYKKEVVGFLVTSQWVFAEADALGIHVTDPEVHKQFAKIRSEQFSKPGDFEKFLATSGQTVSDLLLRVKLNMLSSKIQQKIVKEKSKPTDAQIAKYYEQNKSKYATPEKRDVNVILTKTEAEAASAKKEIESGQSFATVAKKVSIDPTSKANGGMLNEVVKGQEEEPLNAAIFSAQKGVLSGPLKTPFGYYVYEVTKITPGTQQTLQQATPSIKAQLATTGEQAALTKFVKEFKTKWLVKTSCASGFVMTDCKEYKAAKTGTTTTG